MNLQCCKALPLLGLLLACDGTRRAEGQPARPPVDAGQPPRDAGAHDAGGDGSDAAVHFDCSYDGGRRPSGEGPRSPSTTLDQANAAHLRALQRRRSRSLEALNPGSSLQLLRIRQLDVTCGQLDLFQLVDIGRGLFEHEFLTREGLGNGLAGLDEHAGSRERPNFRRFQRGEFGGPETTTCTSCHWKGGDHGAGDRTDNSYLHGDAETLSSHDERNPPALLGLGWVQIAAQEMSGELANIRDAAVAAAAAENVIKEVPLISKGVSFGTIRALPDGTVQTDGVEGVDPDLIIKPFGWKGVWPNLRRFAEGSLQFHFGIQAESLIQQHLASPIPERVGHGADPLDPDADGVRDEITDGQLTALETYLATFETGITSVPTEESWMVAWIRGETVFREVGCTGCHVPYLDLDSAQYTVTPDVGGHPGFQIDLSTQSAEPRPTKVGGKWRVYFFSDFRRHDMGELMAGPNMERGVEPSVYLTRRLWGLSRSSPYLYDGRASTFDEAIMAHGGEATGARSAFEALSGRDKGALRVYLLSLTRVPNVLVR